MIDTIYIEEEISQHPRTQEILSRFPQAVTISCERYGEVFNRRAQNFRLQKRKPALILARKHDGFVLETPAGYGIGGQQNYYFSHMLNCVYDCRYCFLQGMYQSAHYIVFVNYEDFAKEIQHKSFQDGNTYFFSGYDCDSLALDQVTGFIDFFLPLFDTLPDSWLELRTKSVQIRALEQRIPCDRIVAAFSLSPQTVVDTLEHQTPSLERRLAAMVQLAQQGWWIGLRFDPLIYFDDYQSVYREFFDLVFKSLPSERIHSVSLGTLRFPKGMFHKMIKLYPNEPVLAGPLATKDGLVSYENPIQLELIAFCNHELQQRISQNKIFNATETESMCE